MLIQRSCLNDGIAFLCSYGIIYKECIYYEHEHLRADDTFVADEGWHRVAEHYHAFIDTHNEKHILFLELDVGMNTPVSIKYPFWKKTYRELMHWHPDYEFLLIKDGVLVRDDYGENYLLKKKAGSESNLRTCSLYILPPTPAPELKPNIRQQMMSMVNAQHNKEAPNIFDEVWNEVFADESSPLDEVFSEGKEKKKKKPAPKLGDVKTIKRSNTIGFIK
jgi:hypothetical protein